jgi:hypothetical protein
LVVFGSGRAFTSSVAYFGDLRERGIAPSEIRYFGDLDRWGLEIPADASLVAADLGLPPVWPAERLYEHLLDSSIRQTGAPLEDELAEELVQWLPASMAARVLGVLTSGVILKQENVGRDLLEVDGRWSSRDGLGHSVVETTGIHVAHRPDETSPADVSAEDRGDSR